MYENKTDSHSILMLSFYLFLSFFGPRILNYNNKYNIIVMIVNIANTENIDFKCSHSDDSLYTMPHDHCASYYRCQSHQIIKFDCPLGMIFDFYLQKCISNSSKYNSIKFM